MVGENLAHFLVKVMPPYFQGKNHYYQFQIMAMVINLMLLKLLGSIGNYSTVLHQDAIRSLSRCITEKDVSTSNGRKSENWSRDETILQLLEILFTLVVPFKFNPFSS